MLRERRMDLLRGADGHGALVHDHLVVGDDLSQVGGHAQHVLQVGTAVLARRRGQGQEDHLGLVDGLLQLGGEMQPALPDVPFEEHIEVRLIDGHLTVLHLVHLGGVDVHAHDVIAGLGETGPGDQADVSGADYCDVHAVLGSGTVCAHGVHWKNAFTVPVMCASCSWSSSVLMGRLSTCSISSSVTGRSPRRMP